MNGYAALRRVYVRPPDERSLASWDAFGWHDAPDARSIEREHLAFREHLAEAGAEVVTGSTPVPGDPDAIYAYDPVLVIDDGAIMLRPGKEQRRSEPEAVARDLEASGVPVLAALETPATAEGGDLVFQTTRRCSRGSAFERTPPGWSSWRRSSNPAASWFTGSTSRSTAARTPAST